MSPPTKATPPVFDGRSHACKTPVQPQKTLPQNPRSPPQFRFDGLRADARRLESARWASEYSRARFLVFFQPQRKAPWCAGIGIRSLLGDTLSADVLRLRPSPR